MSYSQKFKSDRRLISLLSLVIVAVFFVSSAPSIVFAASSISFSVPINLSNDSAKAVDPDVFNVGSHVYVVWSEGGSGIRFRESPNGGATWVPPLTSVGLKLSKGG